MGVARVARCGMALAAVLGIAIGLGACSRIGSSMPGSFPSWLGGAPREVPLENQTAQQIYLGAEQMLAQGDAREAGQQFSEVERLYPYSEWAKRAMLMSAFAYHEGAQYAESRSAAERYLEFYPADVDAPYAQFLIALSYYDQIVDIGRDQTNAFDALQEMRDIIERYPDSEYAKSAQMKFELALDQLAGKEMEIGRYYLKRSEHLAAHQPLQEGDPDLRHDQSRTGGAAPPCGDLPVDRTRRTGAGRGGSARLQLSGLGLVRRQLRAADRARPAARQCRRQLAEPDLPPGRPGGMALIPGAAARHRCCSR